MKPTQKGYHDRRRQKISHTRLYLNVSSISAAFSLRCICTGRVRLRLIRLYCRTVEDKI